jgi:arabinan endo-1,5-alpha-L-arabinosidase
LTLNTGTDEILNFQQGGLLVYVNDDLFTRLDNVAIWNTRQTEFGKEMVYANRTSNGGTIVGPPGETTYLRIVHHFDAANNEHELRAWTMREGGSWVMGGVWTLPGDEHLQVGLVSQGRQTGDRKTSVFDYFRSYTD